MPNTPTSPSELEQAVKHALADMFRDPAFTRHLAEEIADQLDGIDDKGLASALDEAAEHSLPVSEADIEKALKR